MKLTDYFGEGRLRLKRHHATRRIRVTRANLHRLPQPLQHKRPSESVPLKLIYADILATSVRPQTQPCFDGSLPIGEDAVAAAERSRLGLPALSRKFCSAGMPGRIKEQNDGCDGLSLRKVHNLTR